MEYICIHPRRSGVGVFACVLYTTFSTQMVWKHTLYQLQSSVITSACSKDQHSSYQDLANALGFGYASKFCSSWRKSQSCRAKLLGDGPCSAVTEGALAEDAQMFNLIPVTAHCLWSERVWAEKIREGRYSGQREGIRSKPCSRPGKHGFCVSYILLYLFIYYVLFSMRVQAIDGCSCYTRT